MKTTLNEDNLKNKDNLKYEDETPSKMKTTSTMEMISKMYRLTQKKSIPLLGVSGGTQVFAKELFLYSQQKI